MLYRVRHAVIGAVVAALLPEVICISILRLLFRGFLAGGTIIASTFAFSVVLCDIVVAPMFAESRVFTAVYLPAGLMGVRLAGAVLGALKGALFPPFEFEPVRDTREVQDLTGDAQHHRLVEAHLRQARGARE